MPTCLAVSTQKRYYCFITLKVRWVFWYLLEVEVSKAGGSQAFQLPVRNVNSHQKDSEGSNAICAAHVMYLLLVVLVAFSQVSHRQFLRPT